MSNAADIARLKRHFGNALDEDILASVLAVNDGDVNLAISYLTAQEGDFVFNPNAQNDGIPEDYPGKTKTNILPRPAKVNHKDTQDDHQITTIKKLFLQEGITFPQHHASLSNKEEKSLYIATLLYLLHHGVEISKGARSRVLASCWALHDSKLPSYLLSTYPTLFGVPEVLRALSLLDAGRKIRGLEKRVQRLTKQGNVKPKKIAAINARANELRKELIEGAGVSGALAKKMRVWVKEMMDEEKLAFFALVMPKEPWKEMADLLHFHPNDFQLDWFLKYIFTGEAPKDAIVNTAKNLSSENVVEELKKGQVIPYSYLRLNIKPIPNEAKALIAKYTKLDTLIWYYEELATPEVDKILLKRLKDGEKPTFTYGKLMERLLYFKRIKAPFFPLLIPIANDRLKHIELELEPPVAVLGDASYSMDVAIRTSTIIASVLTVLTSAELKFFNSRVFDAPKYPETIEQVIDVATNVKADGLTAPACALLPYYRAKKVVKFFVMVSDEIENEKHNAQFFPTVFLKYYQEVYPAKIVFISFLEDPNVKGRMVTSLENMGFEVLQFRLDGNRPDLTKLDSILGILSSESSLFPTCVRQLAEMYETKGLEGVKYRLENPPERKRNTTVITQQKPLPQQQDDRAQEIKKERQEYFVRKSEDPKNKLNDEENIDIRCPLTLDIMKEPVICSDGHSYEKKAIEEWLEKHDTSPMTNQKLANKTLIPNHALRNVIEDRMKKNELISQSVHRTKKKKT